MPLTTTWHLAFKPLAGLFAFLLARHAQACSDALLAQVPQNGDRIVIGDYGCTYPEKMIFRLAPQPGSSDGVFVPQDAQPFDVVCSRLSKGGFKCGPRAPFGLANTRWTQKATTRWACKEQNYRPPKFVCSRGCDARNPKLEFFVETYECE